jgi:hypothetical protein
MTLATGGVVAALYEKAADVIDSVTRHAAVGKCEVEVHAMTPRFRHIIVKARPGSGWKELFAHAAFG